VKLVLQRGEFSASDTAATAELLRWYSIAVVPAGILLVLQRGFHARRDMVTPLILGVVNTSLYIIAAILLARSLGISGLPIAFTLAQCFGLVFSFVILARRIKCPPGELLGKDLVLICFAGFILFFLILGWASLLMATLSNLSSPSLAAALALSFALSGFLYLALAQMLGITEAKVFVELFVKRIPRKQKATVERAK
jgi:putative peptidoglycan lipid II flippase